MDTKQANAMIANFMDGVFHEGDDFWMFPVMPYVNDVYEIDPKTKLDLNDFEFDNGDLEYHKSWDWLMPVVLKIKDTHEIKLGMRTVIIGNVRIAFGKSPYITVVWGAVVKFLSTKNRKES